MTLLMFDSITVSELPAGSGYCYAGYVNGNWPTYNTVKSRFPGAHVLSIAVTASADAMCLDVETGDASPSQAANWFARQVTRGQWRPVLYANISTMRQVITVMEAASIPLTSIRLWSAHYGSGAHICGPDTCRLTSVSMDGTQWTDVALGRNLDESVLLDSFFGAAPPPSTDWQVKMMNSLPTLKQGADDAKLPHWYVRRIQGILNAVWQKNLTVDGVFGPATTAAIKSIQQSHLTVDGIVGPSTWALLVAGG